jgi:Asp/Glu/hydantoin racemase
MTVAFIHTVTTLASRFDELADELIPGVERCHVVDESLLGVTRKTGTLSAMTKRRVLGYIVSAAEGGAGLVVVTCSSIGAAVDESRGFGPVPTLRIDEPMADAAVQMGNRVGILATLSTTMEPTAELVARRGLVAGREIELVSCLCEGAFEALAKGDRDRHDELVLAGLRRIADRVDVVVLAQASMARVTDALAEDQRTVPILSSPRLGMERVAQLVREYG